jgi:hypothetical protein
MRLFAKYLKKPGERERGRLIAALADQAVQAASRRSPARASAWRVGFEEVRDGDAVDGFGGHGAGGDGLEAAGEYTLGRGRKLKAATAGRFGSLPAATC